MTRRLLVSYLTITALVLAVLVVPLGLIFADHESDALFAALERDATSVAAVVEDDPTPRTSARWVRTSPTVGAVLHEAILGGNGFVSGHSAVAAALATAAAPYLSRRLRRVAWALAVTVGLARIYVGAHLPLDVVGGLLVGWICGSLVHYAFGVPRWSPAVPHVARLLARFGLPAQQLRPAAVPARSSHPFWGTGADGSSLFIKVLDPDPFDRDWLYRGARMLVVGDVRDVGALAPLGRQAADEAVAAMTARERGVRVPTVLLARGTDGRALVVQKRIDARSLDSLAPEEITAVLLDRVWEQVALLRAARIAHRDLVASNVLVDRAGNPWIVDFGNAETGAGDDTLDRDVAELMASLALRTDPGLVVGSAVAGLGGDVLTRALPGMEPLALSAVTRAGLRTEPTRLDGLRRETHRRLGLPDPERPRLQPAGVLVWLAVVAGAATVFVGLEAIGGTAGVLAEVEFEGWRWLGAAVALTVVARGLHHLAESGFRAGPPCARCRGLPPGVARAVTHPAAGVARVRYAAAP
ncbi:phosphatase PAP2 family protein [Blastococcus sp. VKM Ac-2987]|uniref:phosphatase PAP2 family protein n=1 Tax=Blastococcus sp. VKM Ac-2987 TaxID=3004141 RepID=UPI0022AB5A39|nr:phosphatase PAP2 family protein [Blastococcus sp. VKM Ac-2987]MCZ2857498.1 phosphatase PAP2 family protein [Blastococcus sp. VKM Ac-2987]